MKLTRIPAVLSLLLWLPLMTLSSHGVYSADLLNMPGWVHLKLGEARGSFAFVGTKDGAFIVFNKKAQVRCYDTKTYGGNHNPGALLQISPPSPHGLVAAVCADGVEGWAAIITDVKKGLTLARISQVQSVFPWVSWSPSGQFALLSLKTDEDNSSLVAVDLRSGKARILKDTYGVVQNEDASEWSFPEVVWVNDQIFKYRVPHVCDDDNCSHPRPYEYEVSLVTNQTARKAVQPSPTQEVLGTASDAPFSSPRCRLVLGAIKRDSYPIAWDNWTEAVIPLGLSIRNSSKADVEMYQTIEQAIGPILQQAKAVADQTCNQRTGSIVDLVVYLFFDKVPSNPKLVQYNDLANSPAGMAILAEYFPAGGPSGNWKVLNAAYYVDKRVKAEQQAAKAEQQKLVLLQKHGLFVKKYSLKEADGLQSNPFAFEGENIEVVAMFDHMQTASTGVFGAKDGPVIVSGIPKGVFLKQGKVLLAVKVLGNVKYEGTVGGVLPFSGMVPNLKYIGALICTDEECGDLIEK
jgi:hypothetical protein